MNLGSEGHSGWCTGWRRAGSLWSAGKTYEFRVALEDSRVQVASSPLTMRDDLRTWTAIGFLVHAALLQGDLRLEADWWARGSQLGRPSGGSTMRRDD